MAKTLVEMAAEIVKAQAGVARMSPDEIELSLTQTFETLRNINSKEQGAESEVEPVSDELEWLRKQPHGFYPKDKSN